MTAATIVATGAVEFHGSTLRCAAQFHVLAKPTGAICNLDCAYCFFLSKESLYPGDRFRMSDELLEQYLVQLIDGHQGLS